MSYTYTYIYDADGMRTRRTNGSTTYSYVYNGGSLSRMTVGSTTLDFRYDASGTPMTVTYGGTTYYYATNLQGDVVAILDGSGTAVVSYTYDAWGNVLSTTGSLASTLGTHNPLRYRGYVYDTETELYYLQSRYYDPSLGRFLNADVYASTGQGLLGNNMFAYCRNNPVNKVDFFGFEDKDATEENEGKNKQNMMAFFGVDAEEDVPTLEDNCMVFVENIKSISFGKISIVYGKTIVMDNDKYCEFRFVGISTSKSATPIPIDGSVTKGYVYNVETPEDYCGLFVSPSVSTPIDVKGYAVAPNGVYAEIISGQSFLASAGISFTYYSAVGNNWIYGKANIRTSPRFFISPYDTTNQI